VTSEAPEGRWLTYRELGHLLGVGERAALNWVREHNIPVAPGRPARVALALVVAQATALNRPLAPLPNTPEEASEALPRSSEVNGSASEPIEASYHVIGDPPHGGPLVPLATMVEELRGLADQLAELARRNEGLALEVGGLRATVAGHAGQVAAKDAALAAKDETIAELRRRAEAAEAALALHLDQPGPDEEHASSASAAHIRFEMAGPILQPLHDAPARTAEPTGRWAALRRWWRGEA
jgi:hypothetical protein